MWDHKDSLRDWFIWKLPQVAMVDRDLAEHIFTLLGLCEKYGLEELEQYEAIRESEFRIDVL
jgi:hypothetical protein